MSPAALHRLRAVALAAGLIYVLGAPALVQVFGAPLGPVLRSWRMYRKVGLDLCEVRYTQRMADGRTIPLDRWEILKVPRDAIRFDISHLVKPRAVQDVGRQLCEALPGADVRARARCATPDGWATRMTGEERLCER